MKCSARGASGLHYETSKGTSVVCRWCLSPIGSGVDRRRKIGHHNTKGNGNATVGQGREVDVVRKDSFGGKEIKG